MKTERGLFEEWYIEAYKNTDIGVLMDSGQYSSRRKQHSWDAWQASASREGYKLVPCNPTEEMWGGLARHLVKYMQSHDRYCPKTLGKYINRFIGFKNIPDWLNKEIPDWESDHAFATADLGVFIYKSMIEAA